MQLENGWLASIVFIAISIYRFYLTAKARKLFELFCAELLEKEGIEDAAGIKILPAYIETHLSKIKRFL